MPQIFRSCRGPETEAPVTLLADRLHHSPPPTPHPTLLPASFEEVLQTKVPPLTDGVEHDFYMALRAELKKMLDEVTYNT